MIKHDFSDCDARPSPLLLDSLKESKQNKHDFVSNTSKDQNQGRHEKRAIYVKTKLGDRTLRENIFIPIFKSTMRDKNKQTNNNMGQHKSMERGALVVE